MFASFPRCTWGHLLLVSAIAWGYNAKSFCLCIEIWHDFHGCQARFALTMCFHLCACDNIHVLHGMRTASTIGSICNSMYWTVCTVLPNTIDSWRCGVSNAQVCACIAFFGWWCEPVAPWWCPSSPSCSTSSSLVAGTRGKQRPNFVVCGFWRNSPAKKFIESWQLILWRLRFNLFLRPKTCQIFQEILSAPFARQPPRLFFACTFIITGDSTWACVWHHFTMFINWFQMWAFVHPAAPLCCLLSW